MSTRNTTWIIFAMFILLNIFLFILGLFDIFDAWPLYQIPLSQMGWLSGLANSFGFDVFGKSNEFAASPNLLGLVLIVIGSCISLIVNYLVARGIARLFVSKSESAGSN